jgi:hypothetical protein
VKQQERRREGSRRDETAGRRRRGEEGSEQRLTTHTPYQRQGIGLGLAQVTTN